MRDIGSICNYYGALFVKQEQDQFYWGIRNFDGILWEKIPQSLYNELLAFDEQSAQSE